MDIKERVLGHGLRWWARHGGIAQFHRPTGAAGHVAGWIMGRRSSNVARNRWAATLLDVQPAERVLELGCGPGVAVAALAGRATRGLVVGVDHSPVMIRQAGRRNRAAVKAGRVRLVPAPVESLSLTGEPFDAVLAVNTIGMWPAPAARLRALARLLRPGGRIALVSQPRCPGATSVAAAEELAALLTGAGFTGLRTETLDLDPPVVCVLGSVPPDVTARV
ncbi:class I SAM-dependent methyltransferase [Amycolatopsis sp., V23-08]|uniref:Class I SAM-dependent methyltransferase n=1 Tax=Amycolatopsis heterodermiae TaxID=3110235 RepID=A0ABU5RP33_9PSEU|nr:class I SAM-dependent methyltransferase [Amycolatopsis sp., V23-08]MEA5367255.1 class I SAM-dependent methyltransferase [Amycolatopsis sp., V23-08]